MAESPPVADDGRHDDRGAPNGAPATSTALTPDELDGLFTFVGGGIISVDAAGRVVWASRLAENLLASGGAPLVGAAIADVIPELELSDVEVGELRDATVNRSVGASPTHLEVSAFRSPTGALVRVTDTADRIGQKTFLRLTRRQLAAAAEQSPIGLALVSLNGTYLRVNDAFCRLLGRESDELVNAPCQSFTHPDDHAEDLRRLTDLAVGRMFTDVRRKRLIRADGREVWVELHSGVVMDDAGTITCISTQAVDISKEIETEQARKIAEESARKALADLSYRSSHDTLTGLLNRRALLGSLDRLLADARRAGEGVAIMFCDLDNLKEINDGVSHEAGDAILIQLADSLRRSLRTYDLVGRVGGDEFVVVLRDVGDEALARRIAEQIRERASAGLAALVGLRVPSGVSMGVRVDDGSLTASQLLRDADSALHEAKMTGRNQIVVFDRVLQERLDRNRSARSELSQALDAGQIEAWFQPIVDLSKKRVVGYEALARWVRDGDVLDAGEWLPAIADTPLISRVGDIMVTQTVAELGRLPEDVWIAVNISAREFGTPDFVSSLAAALDRAGVTPRRFIVEVTESVVMDRTVVRRQLDALVAAGIQLHFDDFGTGYASLNHLNSLPVSGVKLDRSFTKDLVTANREALALVRGIAGLADELGLSGVAEGIETDDQARILLDAGWRYGQGFLFGAATAAAH